MADLERIVHYANEHESHWSRQIDGTFGAHQKEQPPWNKLLGPIHDRGPATGVILHKGKKLIDWGTPDRADLTYSVVKTYLALVAGVAWDKGLITDIDSRVGSQLPGIGFDSDHNHTITWRQLLQQTSEWEGTLWGIPDQVDRNSTATYGRPASGPKGAARPLQEPGSYWEYNDIRVNQLAYALLMLFKQPLPEVFFQYILTPLQASDNWQWVGYENSWVTIDGKRMQSVTGGTHWGGGMSISANDQALIGKMMLNDGKAGDTVVLSSKWIEQMITPCAIAPFYGYMVWLNTEQKIFDSLSESAVIAVGAGSSLVCLDREYDLIVVIRWIEANAANGLLKKVIQAINDLA